MGSHKLLKCRNADEAFSVDYIHAKCSEAEQRPCGMIEPQTWFRNNFVLDL